MSNLERITAAAIKYADDFVAIAPKPGRHHTIMHAWNQLTGLITGGKHEQGFVTSLGRFVNREEGLLIALAADQIVEKNGNEGILFSEDMW